jgi:hypothetical protein
MVISDKVGVRQYRYCETAEKKTDKKAVYTVVLAKGSVFCGKSSKKSFFIVSHIATDILGKTNWG